MVRFSAKPKNEPHFPPSRERSVRSVIGSAIKNKKNVLTAIADLVALPLPKAAG
ncbi:MAG: hypothetical protein U5L45_23555 [Saprospiraceae bacterium]|nr:hypothetical protein [Saprospiraceae bacterium]